jgi:hypothetical protein
MENYFLDFYLSSTFAAVLLASGRFVRVLSSISECFAGRNLGISPEFRENRAVKKTRGGDIEWSTKWIPPGFFGFL